MNRLKLLNFSFKIFLLSFFFVISAQAKSLPPGTGEGDVPSNVLIMLDSSGSMSWCMPGGDYMCMPDDITADEDGDLFIIQYPGQGLIKMHYDTLTIDTTFADSGLYDPTDNDCKVLSSGLAYGIVEYHNGFIYSTDFWRQQVVKINSETGECVRKWDIDGHPNALAIVGDTLFVSKWSFLGGTKTGITSINLTSLAQKSCTQNSLFNFTYGITVDSTKQNLYMFDDDDRTIKRFVMSDDNGWCPDSTTPTSSWALNLPGMASWENNVALRMNPDDDNVMFIQGTWTSKVAKATLNSSKNGFTYNWDIGRLGWGKSTTSDIQFGFPWGLGVDVTNKRLLSANWNSGFGQVFDFDGNFIKSTEPSQSRMQGATTAIRAVVSDDSLSNDINFGFGHWSWKAGEFGIPAVEAKVSGWIGSVETGEANPCNSNNCIKVAISDSGANKIVNDIVNISPTGGTDANTFADMATDYYDLTDLDINGAKVCPKDDTIICQKNYIVVIGDGDFQSGDTEAAKETIAQLAANGVLTIMVGYGPGLTASGKVAFNEFAVIGDPEQILSNGAIPTALFARTEHSLKTQLSSLLSGIVAQKFSFTAPAISATIEEGGSLFQATFEYRQNKEWKGTLLRKKIDSQGNIDDDDAGNWSFVEKLPAPQNRKVWTVLVNNEPSYKSTNYNNFHKDNSAEVAQLFGLTGSLIHDYHRKTSINGSSRLARCKDENGVQDGVADDIKGLIEFTRGTDYFDYAGDCKLTKEREHPFGEIYHSELIVVGAPNAETSFNSKNQEAYWRTANNYGVFKQDNENREKVIYVGSNSGALHAINATTGNELWAFIPPFIAAKFPSIINTNLNSQFGGGSTAIYGVDGSPTVHDMFFDHPIDGEDWYTILIIPYGRGGAGFSVLDITKPTEPLHLYSIFNDEINHNVHHVDENGKFSKWDYKSATYPLINFKEAKLAIAKDQQGENDTECKDDIVDGQLTTTCFKGKVWTFPITITQDDIKSIKVNEVEISGYVVGQVGGDTIITFANDMVYQANIDAPEKTTPFTLTLDKNSNAMGVTDKHEKGQFYDYSTLAETWSSPRIFRMPNTDAPDIDYEDDIYVAVMGAGISKANEYVGSSVFVINLEDSDHIGKVEKKIAIVDIEDNLVVSSTPATPTVVTADTGTTGIRFRGALVYQPDYEGKITKINLTNMKCDNGFLTGECPAGSEEIKRFDTAILFNAETDNTNKRFMFHALDATVGSTTSGLWLFNSTGSFSRINDRSAGMENILFGIRDKDFPNFKKIQATNSNGMAIITKGAENKITNIDNLDKCTDTTGDNTGENCPNSTKRGWVVKLKDFAKGSAEPTVFAGRVYFPIYKPNADDFCAIGNAYICAFDDECGTNRSVNELNADDSEANSNKCINVGSGILSRIIVFANKLFANLSGTNAEEKNMISINTGILDAESVRDSWRENY